MKLTRILLELTASITGTTIYRDWELPPGINVFKDFENNFPGFSFEVIFDVGANIGQSAETYARAFPDCRIFSFEPVTESYHQLVRNMEKQKNVKCLNLALSSSPGKIKIASEGTSTMNRVIDDTPDSEHSRIPHERVHAQTLDQFRRENSIKHISFLKIDTEGHDLDVLSGAIGSLGDHSIDFVEVEAGMNPSNSHHVSFERLKRFLEGYGYFLLNIYEQASEWPTKSANLRRCNCIFVSERVILEWQGRA
jgi:FkbM family methyltransferase